MLLNILCTLSVAYLISSIIYIILNFVIDTPLKKSLSKKQRKIYKDSAKKRGIIFGLTFLVVLFVLLIFPLYVC